MDLSDLVVFDLETGGTNARVHPILAVAVVSPCGERFHRLILPKEGAVIEAGAVAKNGYTREGWVERGAVGLVTALMELRDWLTLLKKKRGGRKASPLAHNASFDRIFLEVALDDSAISLDEVLGFRWECSMALLSSLIRAGMVPTGGVNLARLATLVGLEQPAVHDALEDALLCLAGYQWCLTQQAGHVSLAATKLIESLTADLARAESLYVNAESSHGEH